MMMTQTRTTLALGGFAAAMMLAGAAAADGGMSATPNTWGAQCADLTCPAPVARDQLAPTDWAHDTRVAARASAFDAEAHGVVISRGAEFQDRLKAFWTVGVFR